ncbi:MAG: META domain-containing protein [Cyanobacteriota bacterium]|nr:META domain-containing protein [Cyanobacteriota bacterium]
MNSHSLKLGSGLMTLLVAIGIFTGLAIISPRTVQAEPMNSENSTTSASESSLDGTSWILVNWSGENASDLSETTEPITANFVEGQVKGNGSCNRYLASYKVEGQQLKITPAATTRKACMGDIMDREFAYLRALEAVQNYEINEQGQLEVSYDAETGSGILTFAPQTMGQLENLTWVLVSLENGTESRVPLRGTEITVNFTENQVQGFGSCNQYLTDYTKQGNTLDLNVLATTTKSCPTEIMRQEFQYLKALENARWYEINPEGQLRISYDSPQGSGIMTFVPQSVQPESVQP